MAESPQIDNPVIKPDEEGEALLALSQKVDAEGFSPNDGATAQPEPVQRETGGEIEPKEPEVKSSSEPFAEPARDELGRFTKADGTKSEPHEKPPAQPEKKPEEIKAESDYTKARKDRERFEANWKKFDEEKAAFRAEMQSLRQQFEQERQQLQQAQPAAQQFTAKAYDDAAEGFEREAEKNLKESDPDTAAGNYALAAKARKAAQEVRQQELQAQAQQVRGGFEQTWKANMESAVKEMPEFADPNSETGQKLQTLFKSEPVFNYLPDGFKKACEVVRLQMAAAKTSELENENKQLKAELSRYQQLTSISGGSPTTHAGPKKFEDMSMEEQGDWLRRQSDQAGGIAA
jgi:chromosome segregation ATPase